MEAYTGFAQVYDTFMDNVPYDEWGEYLVSLLKKIWCGGRPGSGYGMRNRSHDPLS